MDPKERHDIEHNDTRQNNALHYAECRVLFTVMLSVIMLNVVMLSVVVLFHF